MPHIKKLPNCKNWIAGFTLPDGRRTTRSTHTTDRKKALKIAEGFEAVARNRMTEAHVRRVISDLREVIHGAPLDCPTLSEYTSQWLERKKGEIAAVTLKAYEHAIADFTKYAGPKAAEAMHYIAPKLIVDWRNESAAKATALTANNKLKILRTLFQSAWRDGHMTDNPAAKVQTLKTVGGNRRPFTFPEIQALLRHADTEWQGMILFGLYTGQRLKDIASLTWANLDTERNEMRLVTSKTERRQCIPLAKPLRAYVADLSASDEPTAPLFPRAAASICYFLQHFHRQGG